MLALPEISANEMYMENMEQKLLPGSQVEKDEGRRYLPAQRKESFIRKCDAMDNIP